MVWHRWFGLGFLATFSACSGAPQLPQLPVAEAEKALCALEVVSALPDDPAKVTLEDAQNSVREFKACLAAPDAGAR